MLSCRKQPINGDWNDESEKKEQTVLIYTTDDEISLKEGEKGKSSRHLTVEYNMKREKSV